MDSREELRLLEGRIMADMGLGAPILGGDAGGVAMVKYVIRV
jgi:hypothetical protein